MPIRGRVGLQGGAEMKAKLKGLPKRVSKKLASQALRAAAKEVQADAVADAPKQKRNRNRSIKGTLAKSIKVRSIKRSRRMVGVLVQTTAKSFPGTFFGSFVDLGHHTRPGKKRPAVTPNPFMERAFNREIVSGKATRIVGEQLWQGIEREVAT